MHCTPVMCFYCITFFDYRHFLTLPECISVHFCRMASKIVSLRYFYEGEFHKNTYVGGKTILVHRRSVDVLSLSVMLEYIKELLNFTEIGGVYMWNAKRRGWKLMVTDADFFELIDSCEDDGEVNLYVDNVVDKNLEPLWPGCPFIVQRPRKNIVAGI